jgi:hypothetical protein
MTYCSSAAATAMIPEELHENALDARSSAASTDGLESRRSDA